MYCYQDCSGGYTTWVAGLRHKGNIPKVPSLNLVFKKKITQEEWSVAHRKQMDWLDTAEMEEIGLPYDGERFNDPDLISFLNRVSHLKKVGYNVPDYVIDSIRQEI